MMMLLFMAITSLQVFSAEKDGYKDIPWGASVEQVKPKIGKAKGPNSCFGLLSSTPVYDAVKNQNSFFPGATLASNKYGPPRDAGPLNKYYKQIQGQEGCAIFFKGKFIAFHLSLLRSEVPAETVKKTLVTKYGEPTSEGEAKGYKHNARMFVWKTGETTIIATLPVTDTSPSPSIVDVFYLSNVQNREIMRILGAKKAKESVDVQMESDKAKENKLEAL